MTIQPLACGCTVAPTDDTNPEQPGTLQNPLTVKQCAAHQADDLIGIAADDLASIASSLVELARCVDSSSFRVLCKKFEI